MVKTWLNLTGMNGQKDTRKDHGQDPDSDCLAPIEG